MTVISRPRTRSSARQSRELHKTPTGLDALTREAIELFALLLARYNKSSRRRAVAHFKKYMESLPSSVAFTRDTAGPEKESVPAEVISKWNLLPEYIQNGAPRPLKAKGLRDSIASLVRRVSRRADPDQVLAYLLSIGAVKRVGRYYLPGQRILQLRRSPRLQRVHHLRAGVAMLRTLERNARGFGSHRLYQFVAEGTIPESDIADFGQEMWDPGDQMLMLADAAMIRRSRSRKRGERAIPVALGIFLSAGGKLPPLLSRRNRD